MTQLTLNFQIKKMTLLTWNEGVIHVYNCQIKQNESEIITNIWR